MIAAPMLLLLVPMMAAAAQEAPPSPAREMLNGLESSFSLPLHDLLVKKHDSEWRNLFDGFSGDFIAYFSLAAPESGRDASGHLRAVRLTDGYVSAAVRYMPISYWFATIDFEKYGSRGAQQPWNPDFTYVVGYDDWHPYTLSLVYANYNGNRFNPQERLNGTRTDVPEGTFTLGWKLKVPNSLDRAMAVHSSGGTAVQVHYSWTPDYTTRPARAVMRSRRSARRSNTASTNGGTSRRRRTTTSIPRSSNRGIRTTRGALDDGDEYMLLADFKPYADAQARALQDFQSPACWARKAILNTARVGFFSSDRTIAEYAREIWHVEAV
jgi:hypothetical protein